MNKLSNHTDESLFNALKGGSELAFRELYDRYWKKLLVRAHILLGNREDAEEIVHDIFVQLWKKRETIEIENKVVTYISAMLRYGCFKLLAESKKRHRLVPFEQEAGANLFSYSVDEYLDFENLRAELERHVCELPHSCQLIFRYSREMGLTDKQIAEKMDISVNTVRTQMGRALRKLRTSLNSPGGMFFTF